MNQIELLNLIQEYHFCRLRCDNILPQGFLGVELATDLPQRRGLVVTKVYPNCPAESAGLQEGDIIVRYNGDEFWSKELLLADIRTTRPLTPVDIDILRGEQRKRIMVILVDR